MPDLKFSIDIRVPRQQVWEEITRTGRIQVAMQNTVLESALVPGAKMRYYSPDRKRVFVVGEVIEIIPPRRLSHTFKFAWRSEPPTVVTWELEETPQGCRVTVAHTGWASQPGKGTVPEWNQMLATLKSQLETGDIPLKVKIMYAIAGKLLFMMPKSTTVEEVQKAGW